MKSARSANKNPISDILFFSGLVFFSVLLLIIFVTIKNECLLLRQEIYHLENKHNSYSSKIKVLKGDVKKLSRRDRIEDLAQKYFELYVPAPESLIVLIEGSN
tara:strand:+ start:54 stop:362 length:309 start_codon:yes stop_codon:yes gene_type:complete